MTQVNPNYLKIENNYLFSKISKEKEKYINKHKKNDLIDLSIGDVTLPLPKSCIAGIDKASLLLSDSKTFTGYPPSSGHDFLKEQIIKNDYINLNIQKDEIFIGDSSKSDISNILDIFKENITVALQDPVYPVYVDSNILRGNKIIYIDNLDTFLPCNEKIDIIYICSPNNPTGNVIKKDTLKKYIDYAIENNCLIFFDSAYEAFIQDENTVHSIYEVENSKKVAIEFRSYSKTAGFTPIRLSYTIVPKEINLNLSNSLTVSLNFLFKRMKDTKYNGPSFISEYAIYNTYITNSKKELKDNINYYLENTKLLNDFFKTRNMSTTSNINSPYVWIKCNMPSWDYFYYLLENYMILGTPGIGFGKSGEGYFRFTGFSSRENTLEAIKRLEKIKPT